MAIRSFKLQELLWFNLATFKGTVSTALFLPSRLKQLGFELEISFLDDLFFHFYGFDVALQDGDKIFQIYVTKKLEKTWFLQRYFHQFYEFFTPRKKIFVTRNRPRGYHIRILHDQIYRIEKKPCPKSLEKTREMVL